VLTDSYVHQTFEPFGLNYLHTELGKGILFTKRGFIDHRVLRLFQQKVSNGPYAESTQHSTGLVERTCKSYELKTPTKLLLLEEQKVAISYREPNLFQI